MGVIILERYEPTEETEEKPNYRRAVHDGGRHRSAAALPCRAVRRTRTLPSAAHSQVPFQEGPDRASQRFTLGNIYIQCVDGLWIHLHGQHL
jgi:hypothetical protein